MDENTSKSLNQLLLALKSLTKTVERSLVQDMVQGVGDTVIKNYRSLHARAVELLPEDFYVRDVLVLDIAPDANDKQKLGQVHLQVSQLTDYLEGLLKAERRVDFTAEVEDLKGLGREISDTILRQTRETIRRAFANIDIGVSGAGVGQTPPQPPHPPQPPRPGVVPPTPPQPPTPPREDESDTV